MVVSMPKKKVHHLISAAGRIGPGNGHCMQNLRFCSQTRRTKPALTPLILLTGMALIFSLLVSLGCEPPKNRDQAGSVQRPPVPVSLAKVEARDLPVELESLGKAAPSARVMVTSHVSGELLKSHFGEGQRVQKGDLLFTLDPSHYEAAVEIAKANLAQSQAILKEHQQEVERRRKMVKRNFISQEDFSKLETQVVSQAAMVDANRASLQKAQLELSHCQIYAPISGRAGRLLIDPGSLVSPGAGSALVELVETFPAYVDFWVPEQHLDQINMRQAQGPLEVKVWTSRTAPPLSGKLDYIANSIDLNTGSIGLRAVFANKEGALWPGQSVRVALVLYVEKGALTAPLQAVQQSPRGQFVYVVDAGGQAQLRPVKLVRQTGELAVLSGELKPGQEVVTDGHLMLYPGAKTVVRELPSLNQSLKAQQKGK